MEKYNLNFKLIQTDKVDVVEYPHLNDMEGVESEIISWLEDLGFEFESFQISCEL